MILLYYATKHYSVSIQRSFVNHNLLRNSLKTTRSKETTKFTRIFTEFNSSLEQSSRTIITSSRTIITSSWRDFEKCLTLATDIMAARSRALCSYARKEEEKKRGKFLISDVEKFNLSRLHNAIPSTSILLEIAVLHMQISHESNVYSLLSRANIFIPNF